MKGVFLHVLGDALGSVVVIISAVIYMVVPKICNIDVNKEAAVTALATTTVANMTAAVETVCLNPIPPHWISYVDPILR